ncbi:hypothetical protein [Rhizobium ruizarguesonis]|uniref:hypothetical protein n=1 Tax=Rhizobium ruizarguesonis TaxID=2081791 RepID=UPI0013BC12F4|nr:hypothetical protein [Rhizobium ruizarguesonis]NEJ64899.1 hypothetical protein [Rhizobium ruizarguesonis]
MIKQLLYELGRGFAYRSISHGEMRTYTTWLPLFITVIAGILYALLPVKPVITGQNGLIESLLTLVSTLPGFYFAGLAAVATFGSTTMDHEMPTPAPEIEMRVRGQQVPVKLTRRLFLSYLFSYLVILSFGLCVALMAINALLPSIDVLQTAVTRWTSAEWPWLLVQGSIGLVLTFVFASMVVSTLHGVFFLAEKIHQP